MEPKFRCPMCSGPIAFWAMQPEFTCHHCNWAVSSNVRTALARAVGVGVVVELSLWACLWFTLSSASAALGVWLAASGVVGFGAGWLALKCFVVLTPMRPQNAVQ